MWINDLLKAKSLGFYNCCEMTTVFLYHIKEKKEYHFFSIFVAEDRIYIDPEEEKLQFLTPPKQNVSSNISLKIVRKLLTLEQMVEAYQRLEEAKAKGVIDFGDGELVIGKLEAVPKYWVNKDSTTEWKLNQILKNNFKNGSYVLEFFDIEKQINSVLTEKEQKRACEMLYEYVPISLFTISDRVGNFMFQFPSLSADISFQAEHSGTGILYEVTLDQRLQNPEDYQLVSEIISDDALLGFGTYKMDSYRNTVLLEVGDSTKLCRTTLMDCRNQLILSRQETTFIQVIHNRFHIGSQFGRERELYDREGNILAYIDVFSGQTSTIGEQKSIRRDKAMEKRRYDLRMEEVKQRKEFLRYGIDEKEGREKALQDIRELMNRGDGHRVYLWDPYLSAQDLLDTWYYTKTYGMELRAITSRADFEKETLGKGTLKEWMKEQAEILEKGSNQYGIRLEFRCQWGGHGYEFHDRFLMIVDDEERPMVWSLGASINTIGKKHHIIQKVLHPQMIVDAFEELWEALDDEECLVWKIGS